MDKFEKFKIYLKKLDSLTEEEFTKRIGQYCPSYIGLYDTGVHDYPLCKIKCEKCWELSFSKINI